MDGWGIGQVPKADAIRAANTPFIDSLYTKYPHSTLLTCGESVGLPSGQMGNSEVGHLNIGAGRIVYQELQRINRAFAQHEVEINPHFQEIIAYARSEKKPIHLMGLVSDGGVHSHIQHFKALLDILSQEKDIPVYIHAFSDGRDTDPKSGVHYMKELMDHCALTTGKIASLTGRYYAMDRDKRWDRIKVAYDALVHGVGSKSNQLLDTMAASYEENITDEFILPIICTDNQQQPIATIQPGDAVFCVNFRTDRCREITDALTQHAYPDQGMQPIPLHYTTMTEYDKTFQHVHVIFETEDLKNTLGEVLASHRKTQLRIAETEKYPHVTFFFSGGREQEFQGEKRLMAPSPKEVATYDFKPEMSAKELVALLTPVLQAGTTDFICLNFANADMVGHTGNWNAVIKAVETVDQCTEQLVALALEQHYTIFITADHGNADYMINEDGSPNTAHTLNPVPFFIVSDHFKGAVKSGKLADIAPTLLHFMDIEKPKEMTGDCLV